MTTHETGATPRTPDQPERLTPDQYTTLQPLMKLATIGNPDLQQKLDAMKPGEIKRRELKRQAIQALQKHGTIGHAAAAAGVSPSTLYRWRDADPEFNAAILEWMHVDQVDQLHQSMYRIATSEDPKIASAAVKAGEFLLKALDRDTYGDQIKQETTVTVNHQVQVLTSYRDKQRAALQNIKPVIDAE